MLLSSTVWLAVWDDLNRGEKNCAAVADQTQTKMWSPKKKRLNYKIICRHTCCSWGGTVFRIRTATQDKTSNLKIHSGIKTIETLPRWGWSEGCQSADWWLSCPVVRGGWCRRIVGAAVKGAGLVHPGRARGDSRRLMDGLSLAGVVRRLPATIVGGRAATRPRFAGCPAGGLFWYFQQIA